MGKQRPTEGDDEREKGVADVNKLQRELPLLGMEASLIMVGVPGLLSLDGNWVFLKKCMFLHVLPRHVC